MMADDVESLTASLVREYLSRKGLKNSLALMDQEMPRDEHSISNRAQLAKEIHIEKLMKKNKEQNVVYRSMLEVIVHYLREKGVSSSSTININKKVAAAHDVTYPSATGVKSTRDKKLSIEKVTKAEKPSESIELLEDNQAYSDLLNKLAKSERMPKEKEAKEQVHMSSISSLSENIPLARETPRSFTPSKTHRSRTRSAGLGGPVVSSGLGGIRGKKQSHTKSHTSELTITGHKFQTDKTSFEDVGAKWQVESSNRDDMLWNEKEQNSRILTTREVPVAQNDNFNRSILNADKVEKTKKDKTVRPGSSVNPRKVYHLHREDLVFEDIDNDLDDDVGHLSLGSGHSIKANFDSKPISLEQAMALKNLVFGTAKCSFNQEWRQQSFHFSDHYGLEYGIVQHKGGPCGVLAAVQAFVIKNILFGEQSKSDPRSSLQPSPSERSKALASSITEILWQAGEFKTATVALPTGFGSSNFIGAGRYKPDQLTENLILCTHTSWDSLHNYVNQQVKQFEDQSSSGCILLLYSAILSRTIKRVTSDMDDPNNRLMGAHGYCSQEMVNLIITGRATSNGFDNVIELDSGGSSVILLKGVEKQASVGLLSLFEHYGSCQIGVNYKNPKFPIWVICSESHFSVLFSTERRLLEEKDQKKRFDLLYYDGLSRQDEEIRLTVDPCQECQEYKDGDLVPPLELVIRTRWKKAAVDWNGTEPIL